ncbi:hypothetical protein BO70DRAFT_366446 [Aspergillus heteromorphus CBS 117.55]|uniref:Metallo-beta-lactamase domain-containing protein n=1 Tax=Aspergillus heteromorphus CBS 117.55 TaxID=1448321 RepID=A0A317UXJ2_9EURO|nr:uncharacterized protein BO70DRAFT_366446 [Aspergillus heteromorphus CBS 117.55]PWY66754.1 hypothetical protein BO70DRAFT_366446 [Aspergillus heteromorphus CBS 117.55]
MASGSLVIVSPVALTPRVHDIITKHGGKVDYIVAPDLEHHIFLSAWKSAFPGASIIAPEGLYEKRQKSPEYQSDPFEYVYTKENKHSLRIAGDFHSEFEVEYVDGHSNREIVLWHKPTRTVIEADLVFNLPATEQYSQSGESPTAGLLNRLFMPLITATPSTWHERFAWHVLSSQDRDSFTESLGRIKEWDFSRIIPCHGDVIEDGAKEVFTRIFARFWNR